MKPMHYQKSKWTHARHPRPLSHRPAYHHDRLEAAGHISRLFRLMGSCSKWLRWIAWEKDACTCSQPIATGCLLSSCFASNCWHEPTSCGMTSPMSTKKCASCSNHNCLCGNASSVCKTLWQQASLAWECCWDVSHFFVLSCAIIESSKSIDIGIHCGLSFLWNAESPRNLQQTKAE